MRSRPRTTPPRWPFWVLLAAWVCANSPQAATYAFLSWMAEARSFTHQQRLTAEVASLLGGGAAERETEMAKTETEAPNRPPTAVPAEAVLKKIQLSLELVAEVLPPALRADRRMIALSMPLKALRAPPPHEPPREIAGKESV